MTIPLVALEPRDDDERPIGTNHADHVAQHVLPAPLFKTLVEPLREPVVHHRAEVLPIDAVVTIRQQQFFSPDQAQRVEQLGTDGVVARLAAGQREQ